MKLYFESLGCARNQVDSEIMIGWIKNAGWSITYDPDEAEAIVVNTCSFIEDAVDESIETILELAEFKTTGKCSRLIVAGCLPERYRGELAKELPEVDIFLGTGALDQVVKALEAPSSGVECVLPDPDLMPLQSKDSPRDLSLAHMAYLKIAEGCSRTCTYCIIPKLRGIQKSRSIDDIAAEALSLMTNGVKELILVAQDTTSYGRDLQPQSSLSELLRQLATVAGSGDAGSSDTWLRVLYGHPESIVDEFIMTVASHANIVPYFDVPIQHVSSSVLKRMGRRYSNDDLYRLFDRIRTEVPDANLRTTIIVGFPGETNKDFDELEQFIETVQFDHLGVFLYSDSEDLPSHRLKNHVPGDLAQERYDRLMSSQMDISERNTQKYIGKNLSVLVEESIENNLYAGRTSFQAPEVDGVTYVKSGMCAKELKIGQFADIRVTDALEYDLVGDAI